MTGRLGRLIGQYIRIASLLGRIEDSRAANRAHKRLTGVVAQLAAFGEDAKRAMMPLLDHENVDVRLYTATQILASRTAEEAETRRAEHVCEQAGCLPGTVGFSAEMTLREWRDGRLGPPFPASPFEQNREANDAASLREARVRQAGQPDVKGHRTAYRQEVCVTVEQFLLAPSDVLRRVRSSEITDLPRMEERAFSVERHFGPILGWTQDGMEFCPDNDPPSRDEILAWLWVIHPELKRAILSYADERLRKIIREYEEDTPHPAPRASTSEEIESQVGSVWSCPWCVVRSTAGGDATEWVHCPIRRNTPCVICLNCCRDTAETCRMDAFVEDISDDVIHGIAESERRSANEIRRICLSHQQELLEEQSSLCPDAETEDLLRRICRLLASF